MKLGMHGLLPCPQTLLLFFGCFHGIRVVQGCLKAPKGPKNGILTFFEGYFTLPTPRSDSVDGK